MADIIKRLSSIKLTLCLIWVIVAASLIGTIFPDLGIYHSWWFVGLLFCLFGNLLCFIISRFSKRVRHLGSFVVHSGVMLILAGGLIGAVWGKSGTIGIREGQTEDSFYTESKGIQNRLPLGFKIRLVDFSLETYKQNAQERSVIVYIKDRELEKEFPATDGQGFSFGGYDFKILQYLPDFAIDMETKETFSRSAAPNNPAILVSIQGPNSHNHRWVFAKFPDFQMGSKDENVFIFYKEPSALQPSDIKDFKSRLEIIEGDSVILSKTIEVNDPLQYKGWTIYQADYNPDDLTWTGLHIKKDPGVGVVYAGFVFLIAGIGLVFFVKPIKI